MTLFIRQRWLEDKTAEDILQIAEFGFIAWEFLFMIYKADWDKLVTNNNNKSFRKYVSAQFNKISLRNIPSRNLSKVKQADISRISLSILPRLSKIHLEKSKFYKKNPVSKLNSSSSNKSYAQASKSNINEIIKIKNAFPKLFSNKILEIHNIINSSNQK